MCIAGLQVTGAQFAVRAELALQQLETSERAELRLESPDTGDVLLSEPLALKRAVPLTVEVAPLDPVQASVLAPPLPIKDIIALQKDLKQLTLVMPNKIELRMVGLREFGPVAHVYKQLPDKTLKKIATGEFKSIAVTSR